MSVKVIYIWLILAASAFTAFAGRGNGGNVRLPADTLVALPEEAGLPAADTSLPKCDVRAEVSRDTLLKYDAIMDSAMRRANVPFMDSMLRVIRYGDVDTLSMACPIEARVYDWLPEPTRPPLVKIGKPFRRELKNGLKVILYEDHSMPLVTFYIGISNDGVFEKDKAGVAELTSRMLLSGVQNRTKGQITDSLANMGSSYRMTRGSFYVSGLKRYMLANFNLFADVILNPTFPLQEFFTTRSSLADSYALAESSTMRILDRVYRSLAFGGKSPAGEFASAQSVSGVSLEDCVDYYRKYWKPNNAVVLVMGDITPGELDLLINSRFRTWKAGIVEEQKISVANDVPSTAVNFIHDPRAQGCNIIISNIADFNYNSPDVFPALFINHVMGGDLLSDINAVLGGAQRTPADVFSLSPDPLGGYMYLRTRTSDMDVVRALAEKTAALQKLRVTPLAEDELASLKKLLIGRIALSLEDRNAMGSYGLAVERGLVKRGFLEEMLRQINDVTADDIMRVAQKYIKPSQFRIVVYGDARKVVPPLELAGYDVSFYDKNARRTERPSLSSPVTDGMTALDVLRKYFDAMGGYAKMRGVTSLKQTYGITIGNNEFTADVLSKTPFYYQEQLMYDGQVYMKKTFNGNMGYTKIERTRTDLSADKVEKQRKVRSIFPLLDYNKPGFKAELDSIVPVRGHFTYKLKVTLLDGSMQNYYMSMDQGVPLRIENVSEAAKKETDEDGRVVKYVKEKISSYSDYSDYKSVEGVKYPFTIEIKDDSGRIFWKLKSVTPGIPLPEKLFR